MKNRDVAHVLDTVADLLEIKGGDSYRVRAYRRAAREIDGLAEDLEEVSVQGRLEEIPGIGSGLAEKIQDILETGTTPAYEEIKAELPEGLTQLLDIPSVGPRTVKVLYESLGVKSLDELEEAARNERIRNETSLGAKAEARILRGIEGLRRRGNRLLLGDALPLAEDVVARLKRTASVKRISEAGSVRRLKETIGDLDIVVETTDGAAVTEAFTSLDEVKDVIETGPSMAAVRTESGLRMDLRLATAENYGAMLHHFTGSMQHNVELRGFARDRGLSISEYGVRRLDSEELVVTGRTEDEIYAALGLPWIPPELREARGEIQAALEGRLPRLIEQGDLEGDLHTHSRASDGRNTIAEMAKAAGDMGYGYIAICDHSVSLAIAHGLNSERLLAQIDEIRKLNKRLKGFRVLAGVEVDIRTDGSLDMEQSVLEKLDIVVAAIHHRHSHGAEQMTKRIVTAIESGLVDVLAHPTGRVINQREPYDVDMEAVFSAALAHSVALEINSYPDRLDLNDIYSRMAKERGIKLAVDSDAHSLAELANMRYGVTAARRGWIESADVINALDLDGLKAWLTQRRPRPEL